MRAPSPRRFARLAPSLALCAALSGCTSAGPEPPPRAPRGPLPVATAEVMPSMPPGSTAERPPATAEAPPPQRSSGPRADPELGPSGVAQKKPQASPDEVALARLRAKLKVCYQQELNNDPSAAGSLGQWTLDIDEKGAVRRVKFACFGLSPAMKSCVEAAMKSMTFDPGERTVTGGSCP